MRYIAIGIDGHQYGLGDCGDIVAAAEIAIEYVHDDVIVAIVQEIEE